MDSHGYNENSRLRASDADRDRAAAVINSAMAEGRLSADEHSERLDGIYAAKTHADIVPLLDDLPGHEVASRSSSPAPASYSGDDSKSRDKIIAILGGASRKGTWHPGATIDVVTVMGGAELDFRDAVIPGGGQVTIRQICIMGGVAITVPPEMRVVDSSVTIMGGVEVTGDSPESLGPDAPVLRITGTCIMGGVEVKRKARKVPKTGTGWRDAIRG